MSKALGQWTPAETPDRTREGEVDLPALRRSGPSVDRKENPSEGSEHSPSRRKEPKRLRGSTQTRMQRGTGAKFSPVMGHSTAGDMSPPTRSGPSVETRQPRRRPEKIQECESQEELMRRRAQDRGRSKGPCVMQEILRQPQGEVLGRESGQTSSAWERTREAEKAMKEAKQMTGQSPGAASHEGVRFDQIDWKRAHREVNRLQSRIVQATKQQRWGKVFALQRLLTRSFSAKAVAVKRVCENHGRRTAGVDGQTWRTPQSQGRAVESLVQRGYRPKPLRRMYIPKAHGQKRPLGIPTMKDRAMQALYLQALDPVAEVQADPDSYGFRKERSCHDALEQCFCLLGKERSASWVLEGDIVSCFDQIRHEWLLAHVPMEKKILRLWLQAGYVEKGQLYPTKEGTPQGGIISPVLCNWALDGLQARLGEAFPLDNHGVRKGKVHLVRYADDFVITAEAPNLLEEQVKPLVETFLKERGLTLSEKKTRITHRENGFDFLGQNLRRYGKKLLLKPSKKSQQAFLRKTKEVIQKHPHATPKDLIGLLNPILSGWANYHRHGVSKVIFGALDRILYLGLWQWCLRRHPHKAKRWVKAKYFTTVGQRHWVFFGEGTEKRFYLRRMKAVPIVRHTKIRKGVNPYDPAWKRYLTTRRNRRMRQQLQDRPFLGKRYQHQGGRCPVCEQPLEQIGRRDCYPSAQATSSHVLLHPTCRGHARSPIDSPSKPRPRQEGGVLA